jgi:hypothetical protein
MRFPVAIHRFSTLIFMNEATPATYFNEHHPEVDDKQIFLAFDEKTKNIR